jgi:hypothetical protein
MFDELHGRGIGHKSREDENRQSQFDQGDCQGRSPDHVFVIEKPENCGASQREKEQAGEKWKRGIQLF